LYYDERIGPHTRLVAITSSLLSSGMPAEEEQWRYLDAHLPAAGHERVILLSHYPLFVDDPDEPASYMNIDPAPRARLISLLDRHGVGLMLCGHQHRPMDRWAGRTRMITAPPVSFGLPRGQQPEGWTLITLDEAGNIEVENRFLPGK
jgi:alkaline phosphatase D